MKKICYIFGGGERTPLPSFPPERENRIIIAADGGLLMLSENGVSPDYIVGDFDSLGTVPTGSSVIHLPREKDTTDMYEAAALGMKNGCSDFRLYGGTGGRLDHTLANIQLCADISEKGYDVSLYGAGYVITVITDRGITLTGRAGAYVSVFSLTDRSEGVCETGLRYSLSNASLRSTFALGVSNEFTDAPAKISVKKGTLAIYSEL